MKWTDVGKRIERLRRSRGLTQEQFGNLIGVSGQYASRIERGGRVSAELIEVICKKLGVSADYLIWGSSDPLANIGALHELSKEQVELGFDILKRLADFINTENGNEALIKELMHRNVG